MVVKRSFDLVAAVIAIAVLSPLLVVLIGVIRAVDGSPVFFSQERVGKGGRLFRLYKFRTMTSLGVGEQELGVTIAGNSRVTRLGQRLRRWKIDELPQLWNILVGEMSVVGPRPEVPKFVEIYPEEFRRVLAVKPGLTDPASIRFRNESDLLAKAVDSESYYRGFILPKKIELSVRYAESRSFVGDLRIILQTVWVVLGGG